MKSTAREPAPKKTPSFPFQKFIFPLLIYKEIFIQILMLLCDGFNSDREMLLENISECVCIAPSRDGQVLKKQHFLSFIGWGAS